MNRSTKEQLEIVNQQIKELVSIYRVAVSRSGISENEFWIWYSLVNMEGPYTQQDICGLWSLTKQTVNTIITNMARKGYLTLEVIPGTRNKKRITLTEEGRAYGESLVLPAFSAEERAYERLSEAERQICTQVLGKYVNLLKEELYGTEKL